MVDPKVGEVWPARNGNGLFANARVVSNPGLGVVTYRNADLDEGAVIAATVDSFTQRYAPPLGAVLKQADRDPVEEISSDRDAWKRLHLEATHALGQVRTDLMVARETVQLQHQALNQQQAVIDRFQMKTLPGDIDIGGLLVPDHRVDRGDTFHATAVRDLVRRAATLAASAETSDYVSLLGAIWHMMPQLDAGADLLVGSHESKQIVFNATYRIRRMIQDTLNKYTRRLPWRNVDAPLQDTDGWAVRDTLRPEVDAYLSVLGDSVAALVDIQNETRGTAQLEAAPAGASSLGDRLQSIERQMRAVASDHGRKLPGPA